MDDEQEVLGRVLTAPTAFAVMSFGFVGCPSLDGTWQARPSKSGGRVWAWRIIVCGLAGESISLKESLGAPSLTTTMTVRPCSQLSAPRAGTRIVSFNDIVPGSILRVVAGGVEIADGSGGAIRTTRDLIAGEMLTITQELPGCAATQFFPERETSKFFRIGVQ